MNKCQTVLERHEGKFLRKLSHLLCLDSLNSSCPPTRQKAKGAPTKECDKSPPTAQETLQVYTFMCVWPLTALLAD